MESHDSTMTMTLPKQWINQLNGLSAKTKRPTSFFIKEALERYWEDIEDVYLADQALLKIKEGKDKIYTSGEMEKMLGLAH